MAGVRGTVNKRYLAQTLRNTVGVNTWLQEDQCYRQRRAEEAGPAPRDPDAVYVDASAVRSERQQWADAKLRAKKEEATAAAVPHRDAPTVGAKRVRNFADFDDFEDEDGGGADDGRGGGESDSSSSSSSSSGDARRAKKRAKKVAKKEKKAAKKAKKRVKKAAKKAKKKAKKSL